MLTMDISQIFIYINRQSYLIQKSVEILLILHVIAGKSIYVQTTIHTGLQSTRFIKILCLNQLCHNGLKEWFTNLVRKAIRHIHTT